MASGRVGTLARDAAAKLGLSRRSGEKIFYISLQRCGTKSFSAFFKREGYRTAGWGVSLGQGWSRLSFEGRYEEILANREFRRAEVFDDGPWHHISLVKYLYWRLPGARFVYFSRPIEDWLRSMESHSDGNVIGNPAYHCLYYGRLEEYYRRLDAGEDPPQMTIADGAEHYRRAYLEHARQIRLFFADKPAERFFQAELYDRDKYARLGAAWGMAFRDPSDVHVHKSARG